MLAVFSIFFSVSQGSAVIPFDEWLPIVINQKKTLMHSILYNIRLPRTLGAFVTGGLLALSGTMTQALLRNPLADPYILGISGGSAVVTLILILLGLSGYALTGGAWLGSLLTTFLVFFFAKKTWNSHRVLLTGIALSSGFSAVISFILILSPDKEWHSMFFWLIGDLSFVHMPFLEAMILLSVLFYSLFFLSKELNILVRGEREATALGVNTMRVQLQLYFLSALLTAAAVALAGCIGFIGLIVPHLLRLSGYQDHQVLLPCSALLGGILLTVADTLSRTLFAPQQLPVGIMMAFLGIPIFIILLHRNTV
jgi:iron complex transport system permease protein